MRDNLTEIALVLDRSGSMSQIESATVEGVNAFLTEQQAQPGDCNFTFVQFDDEYEQPYSGPIKSAPRLTLAKKPAADEHRYEPRGNTALFDAIGRTIDELGKKLAEQKEEDRPSKVIVAIMTDGYENFSRNYNRRQIADMIKLQRDTYQWQFMFLAANQDAIAEAAKYNISAQNAVTYTTSAAGTKNVLRAASKKMSAYRVTGQSVTMGFDDEDRNKAMEQDQ